MQRGKSYEHFFIWATLKSAKFRKIELAEIRHIRVFCGAEIEYEVHFLIPPLLRGGWLSTPK